MPTPSDQSRPNAQNPEDAGTLATPCTVVINRESGTAAEILCESFERELRHALEMNGWSPTIHLVPGREVEATIQRALKNDVGAIITGGGDGTTAAVAGLLRDRDIPLGILPFGTLNLAARDLGTPLDPLDAVKALHPRRTRHIDILEVNGGACLCMTLIGMYPELLDRSEKYHGTNWWRKLFNLSRNVYAVYRDSPVLTVSFSTDEGENRSIRTRFVLLTPGEYQDEWGILPTRSTLSSGRCHAYVSKHLSRTSLLRLIARFLTGKSRGDPDLQIIEASKLRLSIQSKDRVKVAVDGELGYLTLPAEFDLKPRRLTVLDPLVENESG